MLKYSTQYVERLPLAKLRQFPFPGGMLTRVLINFNNGSVYFGKPYPHLYNWMVVKGFKRVREFDKKHLLMDLREDGRHVQTTAWRTYHPYAGVAVNGVLGVPIQPKLGSWFSQAWKIKRIPTTRKLSLLPRIRYCYVPLSYQRMPE